MTQQDLLEELKKIDDYQDKKVKDKKKKDKKKDKKTENKGTLIRDDKILEYMNSYAFGGNSGCAPSNESCIVLSEEETEALVEASKIMMESYQATYNAISGLVAIGFSMIAILIALFFADCGCNSDCGIWGLILKIVFVLVPAVIYFLLMNFCFGSRQLKHADRHRAFIIAATISKADKNIN